jgi:hypothetical protein
MVVMDVVIVMVIIVIISKITINRIFMFMVFRPLDYLGGWKAATVTTQRGIIQCPRLNPLQTLPQTS